MSAKGRLAVTNSVDLEGIGSGVFADRDGYGEQWAVGGVGIWDPARMVSETKGVCRYPSD